MVYTYAIDYSVIKKMEILSTTTLMNLQDFMLSEISQSHKDKCCMILLSEVLKVVTHRNRKLNGGGNRELLFNGYSVSLIQDKKVLEMCSTTLHLQRTILPRTLKKTVNRIDLMLFFFNHNRRKTY